MKLSWLSNLAPLTSIANTLSINRGSLRTDGVINPIAVDSTQPRLSWRLGSSKRGDAQTAYQIQAASSDDLWSRPDFWDSGRVDSDDSFAVYSGKSLGSRSAVYWRVRVWDSRGIPSAWSEISMFEVSLLKESDWKASWISNPEYSSGNNSLPLFAKEFTVPCLPTKARLYLLGLGVHAPKINGEAVGDTVPGTGYSTVEKTALYSTYDVTKQVNPGKNVIGVALGKGIYNADEPLGGRYTKLTVSEQELKLISQLEYTCPADGTHRVVSDDSWLTTVQGPHLEGHWYGGEEYDARNEIKNWSKTSGNRKGWTKASITTGPGGVLVSPKSPQLMVIDTVKAIDVKPAGSQWVFNFGVNFAGTFALKINGKGRAGTRIVFYPSEIVHEDGSPDQHTTEGPIFDAYTIKGEGSEVYSPKFLYHGMQYVGVNLTWTPSASDMTGSVIRAPNERVLELSTSNELFNGIHKIIDRSIQSNMYSVLTDCPHREKYGWLEQDHLVFEPLALGYDLQAYGVDLVRTMADAQAEDVPGLIPDIAPELHVLLPEQGYLLVSKNFPQLTISQWGRAMIAFPLKHYMYYGDANVLTMRHQYMVEYVGYLKNRANGQPYLNDGGLGDWLTLDKTTPKGLASTFGYHSAVSDMAEIEEILGNDAEAANYRALADEIKGGFNSMWFNNTGSPHYATNCQGCNAIALDMGAVADEHKADVLANIIASLEAHGWHWTVGEISLPSLIRVLHKAGRDDVLFRLFSQETVPSYGSQVLYGATSLWEHWDAPETGGSWNHFMFGYGDTWILRLSGLAHGEDSVAWRRIDYRPVVVGDLTSARTSYRTPQGVASASWELNGTALSYDVVVPVGSRGTVYLNSTSVTEGGRRLRAGRDGILTVERRDHGQTVIAVGSGSYRFEAEYR
ncbi:hypothetical protein DL763_000801 [Monosporascus cannonballus]|nr:hypothetical protein DL763_000801 [Monosporascus cannonballus]